MKILWFTWKDKKNPASGGAEIVNEALAKKLVADGHEVIFLVGGYENCLHKEIIDGYTVIRLGNRWTVYLACYQYYKRNLINWADLIIEEINTIPFFTQSYAKEKKVLIFYQLCREIWFYQMFFPLNFIGYLIEPFYLWLLKNNYALVLSLSTKKDLKKIGFSDERIQFIFPAIENSPLKNLAEKKNFDNKIILSLGAIRPMKKTLDIIKAFELSKIKFPKLKLQIAGKPFGKYGDMVLKRIKKSRYTNDIEYFGQISQSKKINLMKNANLIAVTSVKEGWGLIITEAASQGTPAVVYNNDGLRDAVFYGRGGFLTKKNNEKELSEKIIEALNNTDIYRKKQLFSWEKSKRLNFENSYKNFIKFLINFNEK